MVLFFIGLIYIVCNLFCIEIQYYLFNHEFTSNAITILKNNDENKKYRKNLKS